MVLRQNPGKNSESLYNSLLYRIIFWTF